MTAARDDFFARCRGSDLSGHDYWEAEANRAAHDRGRIACFCGWQAEVDLRERSPAERAIRYLVSHLTAAERQLLEEGEAHFLEQHYPPTPTGRPE